MNTLSLPELIRPNRATPDERALRKIGKLVAGFPVGATGRDDISSAIFLKETRGRLIVANVTDYPRDAARKVQIYAKRALSEWAPEAISEIEIDVNWHETYGSNFPPRLVSARRLTAQSMQEDTPETTYDSLRPAGENTFTALDVVRVLTLVPVRHPFSAEIDALPQTA